MRIGLGQMRVAEGEIETNLQSAAKTIELASKASCDLVVLPECLDLGWTCARTKDLAGPIPGRTSEFLADRARAWGVDVVAGLTEREGDRIHNAALWISSQGRILGKHRKINILDIARDLYTPGRSLTVFDTRWGPAGLAICADNFPETLDLGRSLARMGARLIVSPSAWAVDADHDHASEPYGDLWRGAYGTLTREFEVSVIGVSNVGWIESGPWEGRKCIGCSLAMGPGGVVLAEGPYGEDAEELIVFEHDLS